jgi:3-oxoadipate enol-lactonase
LNLPERASNGIFFRIVGKGEPLLLLHGAMASGAMFDPLIEHLRDRFRMILPDLRGHGRSGELAGPYNVPALASDLDAVLAAADCDRCAVMGYSHGGAVAQQFVRTRPEAVSRLMLACTYAVATFRQRMELSAFLTLSRFLSPWTAAKLIARSSKPDAKGAVALTAEQVQRLRSAMAANKPGPMRAVMRGSGQFDSRPWLQEIRVPTLVLGGSHDTILPRHHFEILVRGIPGASGRLIERAGHVLVWTHTRELADIIAREWPPRTRRARTDDRRGGPARPQTAAPGS